LLSAGFVCGVVVGIASDGSNNAWGYKFVATPVFPAALAVVEDVADKCRAPIVFGAAPSWSSAGPAANWLVSNVRVLPTSVRQQRCRMVLSSSCANVGVCRCRSVDDACGVRCPGLRGHGEAGCVGAPSWYRR
jgi:hypothetical protein